MSFISRSFVFLLLFSVFPAFAYDKAVVEDTLKSQEGIAGLKRHEMTIDGQKIFYLDNEREKAGRTIMLVHGFGDSSLSWTFFARIFRDNDYRVIIPDLLGFGRSARPMNADYGYAAQSKRLFSLLDTLKVSSVHLVGNSMGGGIVAEMALEQPQKVASLTLMDAAGVHYKATELDEQVLAGNNFLVPKKVEDFERLIDFASVNRPPMPRPVLDYLADRAVSDQELNGKIFNILFREIDFLILDLDKIKAPTLIVWGEKDRVLSPENAKVFNKYIPNSQVLILPNVGHIPMIEVPEESGMAVNHFIDALYVKK
jgi:pimeloyl-ACP methyl ester carboxylesterase